MWLQQGPDPQALHAPRSSNGSCVAFPDTQSPQKIADFKGDLKGEDIAWASPCQAGKETAQSGSYYLISIPYFWRHFNSWERFLFKDGRLHQRGDPVQHFRQGPADGYYATPLAPWHTWFTLHTSVMAAQIRCTFYSPCWNRLQHFFPSFRGARKFQKCFGGGKKRRFFFFFWSML